MFTSTPSPGARISAELGRDATLRTSRVEYVGRPRCGDTHAVEHVGLVPPRHLPGSYHRLGSATCISGAHRYDYRRR